MLPNQKLKLNDRYALCEDVDRILIVASKEEENETFYYAIHPMYAKFIAFFKGDKTISETIEDISSYFSITNEEAQKIISPLIENEKPVVLKYDGAIFQFPQRLLVYSNNDKERVDLNFEKLNVVQPFNFTRKRLSIPKSIVYVVNTHCATDCMYCYADKNKGYVPLKTERILSIIDEMKNIGITDVEISGGEIFLHKDWKEIVKRIIEYGYNPKLSTKVPLSKNTIDAFEEVGLKGVQISLDSINSHLLQKTLNVGVDYCEKMLDCIRYLNFKGIEIIIKGTQTVHTCDVDNISEVIGFINQFENVKRYLISIVGYSHYKTVDQFNAFRPTKKQIDDLSFFIAKNKNGLTYELVLDAGFDCKSQLRNYSTFKRRSLCSANIDGFIILPDGKVTICEELYWNENFILGDLSQNSILEVWQSDKAMKIWDIQQGELTDDNPCSKCQDFEDCRKGLGVCWKAVIAHYGEKNYLYPNPSCPKAPEPIYQVYYDDF